VTKAVQFLSDEALERSRAMTPDQIIRFLDEFRAVHAARPGPSKLISMKVPVGLLQAFKRKAELAGVPYQTQIKALMRAWLLDN